MLRGTYVKKQQVRRRLVAGAAIAASVAAVMLSGGAANAATAIPFKVTLDKSSTTSVHVEGKLLKPGATITVSSSFLNVDFNSNVCNYKAKTTWTYASSTKTTTTSQSNIARTSWGTGSAKKATIALMVTNCYKPKSVTVKASENAIGTVSATFNDDYTKVPGTAYYTVNPNRSHRLDVTTSRSCKVTVTALGKRYVSATTKKTHSFILPYASTITAAISACT